MELILVRHGQPAWAVDGTAQWDPGLTELGTSQALRAADRLAARDSGPVELVVSTATRARETAEPIAAALGVTPQVVPAITEIVMPDMSGQPTEVVAAAFRDAYRRPPESWWDGMPGGENFRDFHERITAAFSELLAARGVVRHAGHPDLRLWDVANREGTVVVVAHAGVNAVALGFLLGLEPTPWEWERFVLGHASFATVKPFPIGPAHTFSMRAFNDVEHLASDQRTR